MAAAGSREETSAIESTRRLGRLLRAREVAELVGFRPGTILDWFESGKLPGYRISGRVRFAEADLRGWIEEHRFPPTGGKGRGRDLAALPVSEPLGGRRQEVER